MSRKHRDAPPATAEAQPLASLDKPPPDAAAVEQVRKWVLAGHSEYDILDAIREKLAGHDAAELIALAMVSLQRASKWNAEVLTGFIFEATRDVYRRALEVLDLPVALRALKQLAEYVSSSTGEEDDPPTAAEAEGEGIGLRTQEGSGGQT